MAKRYQFGNPFSTRRYFARVLRVDAMPISRWRSPAAYEDMRSLDAPGFAWHFLRRNPDFRRDHKRLARQTECDELTPDAAEEFARRWGVRFQAGDTRRSRRAAALDAPRAAERRPARAAPG